MTSKQLSAIVLEHADQIVDLFVRRARRYELPPRDAQQSDVVDDLHRYVQRIAASLEQGDDGLIKEVARAHGQQRWYVGYDLKGVILEYGVLRSVMHEVIEHTGYRLTREEFDELAGLINAGVAEAAVEFTNHASQRVNEALVIAEAAARAREDIVAVVSHDLRNPLSVIYGTVSLLKKMVADGDREEGPLLNALARIERASNRMNRLITDLLDLAKLKEGLIEITDRDELTSSLLEEAIEQSKDLAERAGVQLVKVEGCRARVACDRERLMQVFDNIVGNGIKFSPKGATMTLGVETLDSAVVFSIRDQGPGIAADHLPMLFERFWKAPRTTGVGGTGLGLAIAKGIVEAHGGRIWVESKLGEGTAFFFNLPGTRVSPADP